MPEHTSSPTDAQTATTTDDNSENTAISGVPMQNETVTTEIIDESSGDKRRVKRTYTRVIADSKHITYVHVGDTLVRAMTGETTEDEIIAIGPDISTCDGMHVQLAEMESPLHLNLIRKWIQRGDAVIYGTRQSTYSEVEGVDY